MPSGSFMTTVGNSVMRLLVCALVGVERAVVMGDDSLEFSENSASELTARYATAGYTYRDAVDV